LNISKINMLKSNILNLVDAAIIFDKYNKRYFTGLNTDDAGTLIICREKAYFIIDSRYIEIAQKTLSNDIKMILQKDLFNQINEIFLQNDIKTYCVEEHTLSVFTFNKLCSSITSSKAVSEIDLSNEIQKLRCIKSEFELNQIKKAQEITEKGFEFILSEIKEGKTEKELALELEFYLRSNGANNVSFDIIFLSGKSTSMPHGVPSNNKVKKGDFITMDFGVEYNGYMSDMTRTVAFGSVSDEMKRVYNTVLSAQNAAFELMQEGIECNKIDAAARNIISDAGFGDYFGHALGHSLGLQIHESPNFSPKCPQKLKEGMVLTVEPGIYIPEKFGVRIEDMVYITKNGFENLTKSNKTLIIL